LPESGSFVALTQLARARNHPFAWRFDPLLITDASADLPVLQSAVARLWRVNVSDEVKCRAGSAMPNACIKLKLWEIKKW